MNKTRKLLRSVSERPGAEARGAHMPGLAAELRVLAASLESEPVAEGVDLIGYARIVSAARADLDRAIGTPWVTDPALEVLLCTFVTQQAGASTGREAELATVPHTARRWVAVLEQAGLIAADPGNTPRLTSRGNEAVARYLTALSKLGADRVPV